jgi:cyclohexadieny/prephenate dehydrogenase
MSQKRIAIFGPGLLGGSIALKLREIGGWHIALWARRPAAVDALKDRNLADLLSTDIGEIAHDADIIVLCVPVEAMKALALEIARFVKPGCIVTDVGSVKECVVAELAPIFSGKCRFIGSHPMAGKAESGIDAAEAGLFKGTNCIVTPGDAGENAEIAGFWESLGCRVVEMGAKMHDECVALISHLPHLVAGNLVAAVAGKNSRAFEVVGPGFRDSTRVASGSPELWTGILQANSTAILDAIDAMIAKLGDFRQMLARVANDGQTEDLTNFLAAAKQTRDQIQFPK